MSDAPETTTLYKAGMAWVSNPEPESLLSDSAEYTRADLVQARAATQWQPIETAPKDRWILALSASRRTRLLVRWRVDSWEDGNGSIRDIIGWHEMPPLPAVPEDKDAT